MEKQYKTIDLFAGIGGIRTGFEKTKKFQNVFSVEKDKYAMQTYEHLYHEKPFCDITDPKCLTTLQSVEYDVLLAGFPCQAFSIAGLKQGFLDHERGNMFFEVAKILRATQPKAFLLENVAGLITHNKGHTFQTILEILTDLNYQIVGVQKVNGQFHFKKEDLIRNPYDFGIPQKRSRVFLVGFKQEILPNHLKLPCLPITNHKTLYRNIEELLDQTPDFKYFLTQTYVDTLKKHKERHAQKNHGFGYCVVNDIPNGLANTIMATGGSGKERNLIRQKLPGYHPDCYPQKGKLNCENLRHMTPNEWAKLQGFANYAFLDENNHDRFSFPPSISTTQQYKLLGNSVCILIIEEIANFIYDILQRCENEHKTN